MKLQVLILRSENSWVAMGLEHCICAQADSLPGVMAAFFQDLALQIILDRGEGFEPLAETPAAPEEYWERYRQSPAHLVIDLPIPEPALEFSTDIRVAA